MARKDHGKDLTGEEMCELLDEFINGANPQQRQEFVQKLVRDTHRTLQQRIAALFITCFEAWAELNKNQYDARNEATVKLAKKIVAGTGDQYDRYLPLI